MAIGLGLPHVSLPAGGSISRGIHLHSPRGGGLDKIGQLSGYDRLQMAAPTRVSSGPEEGQREGVPGAGAALSLVKEGTAGFNVVHTQRRPPPPMLTISCCRSWRALRGKGLSNHGEVTLPGAPSSRGTGDCKLV